MLCLILGLLFFLTVVWAAERKEIRNKEKESWLEDHLYLDTLSFCVEGTGFRENMKCWPERTGGKIYVYLHSYDAEKKKNIQ